MVRRTSRGRGLAPVRRAVLALTLALPSTASLPAAAGLPPSAVPAAEAAILAETYRLVESLGEEIWPGLSSVPFPVLLVTAEREFLIGWEGPPPEGFTEPATDPRLGLAVTSRQRVFSPGLAAAFPAFGPPAVVVIGTLEATGRSPGEWALTLVHEHFHQLQYAAPGYYESVDALDLANGDTSGRWMLEYPFPYTDEAVASRFSALAEATLRAVERRAPAAAAWSALDRLASALTPADARYLSFQLWQEGIGRWVEMRAAEVTAAAFEPGAGFLALDGFDGWRREADAVRRRILEGLETAALATEGRVAFYPVGAALGMLLERDGPAWKSRYLERRFVLAPPPRREPAAAPAVGGSGVEITYLANEGFLLAAAEVKVLIDALFPGLDGYPRVPPALRAKLARAEAPFDGVDAVLATHFHGDHFGAREVARFLAAAPAAFLSTPDAVARLRREAGVRPEARSLFPPEGSREVVRVGDGLRVTALNLHHGRSRPEIQNLGFLVELGGLKILHVGDTEVTADDLRPYGLADERIDVALLPGWLLAEPSWRPVVDEIRPGELIVMHLARPDAPADWFGSAGSLEGRIALIRRYFPSAWIPTRPLAARRFSPAPGP